MKRLGIVTIGQSPRDDIVPDMAAILGPEVAIVQAGAIDDVETEAELQQLTPRPGEKLLVSRTRDGRQVILSQERILPRVQDCINRLEQGGANPILLLCTAQFPHLDHRGLLLEPDKLVTYFVSAVLGGGRLGLLVPESEQIVQMAAKWQAPGRQIFVQAATPYGAPGAITAAARRLQECSPDLVVLDCVGYRHEHKALVKKITAAPVILSNAAVAHMLAELL